MSQPIELLIADDSKQDCDLLAIAARSTALAPTFVSTREAVLPAIDARPSCYRAILLDINMPSQPLPNLVTDILGHPDGRTMLILALSDLSPASGEPIAQAAGIERFVRKPASLDQLVAFLYGLESELRAGSSSSAII